MRSLLLASLALVCCVWTAQSLFVPDELAAFSGAFADSSRALRSYMNVHSASKKAALTQERKKLVDAYKAMRNVVTSNSAIRTLRGAFKAAYYGLLYDIDGVLGSWKDPDEPSNGTDTKSISKPASLNGTSH